MLMIANLRYRRNLFVNSIDRAHPWDGAAIEVAFSRFVLTAPWLVLLAATAIGAPAVHGRNPDLFVIGGAAIYFSRGEIGNSFPATCADAFGFRCATTSAGMFYTANGNGFATGILKQPGECWRRLAQRAMDGRVG